MSVTDEFVSSLADAIESEPSAPYDRSAASPDLIASVFFNVLQKKVAAELKRRRIAREEEEKKAREPVMGYVAKSELDPLTREVALEVRVRIYDEYDIKRFMDAYRKSGMGFVYMTLPADNAEDAKFKP